MKQFQKYPGSARLKTPEDYRGVFDHCSLRASSRHLLILSIPNPRRSRLGLVVAKKHVKLACQRNRIKRVVREFFRNTALQSPKDLVVLARPGLSELSNNELRTVLGSLWAKLNAAQSERER